MTFNQQWRLDPSRPVDAPPRIPEPPIRQRRPLKAVDENDPTPWMNQSACWGSNPDIFFPERGDNARPAKAICATCDVRVECLEYALSNRERVGVWGGLTAKERLAFQRARRSA